MHIETIQIKTRRGEKGWSKDGSMPLCGFDNWSSDVCGDTWCAIHKRGVTYDECDNCQILKDKFKDD